MTAVEIDCAETIPWSSVLLYDVRDHRPTMHDEL